MATWKQIKDFIRSNYKLQEDEGDFFQMLFELEEDRSQMIFVQKIKSEAGDIWVQISSPIGTIEDDEIDDALEMMNDKLCGGMVKIGERHFVRQNMLIDDLSPEQFVTLMQIVMNAADEMEQRFIGSDDN
jgi:1,2-phenylacetyl-CoA epoxidase PaaB subunit